MFINVFLHRKKSRLPFVLLFLKNLVVSKYYLPNCLFLPPLNSRHMNVLNLMSNPWNLGSNSNFVEKPCFIDALSGIIWCLRCTSKLVQMLDHAMCYLAMLVSVPYNASWLECHFHVLFDGRQCLDGHRDDLDDHHSSKKRRGEIDYKR